MRAAILAVVIALSGGSRFGNRKAHRRAFVDVRGPRQ